MSTLYVAYAAKVGRPAAETDLTFWVLVTAGYLLAGLAVWLWEVSKPRRF
jgi:hypothetical protein